MNTPSLAKGTSTTLRPLRRHRWVSPTLNFLRHYAEMVAAMVLGILVLGRASGCC
jgi:hypothetical protein